MNSELVSAIDATKVEYEIEKTSYPTTTDRDRLDSTFKGMNERGVIALQNAGFTQSDGYDDIRDAYSEQSRLMAANVPTGVTDVPTCN